MNNATKTQLIAEATQRITHAVKHGVSVTWGVRAVHESGRLASIANGVALELFEVVSIPQYQRETVLHSTLNDQSNLNALTGLCHDFAVVEDVGNWVSLGGLCNTLKQDAIATHDDYADTYTLHFPDGVRSAGSVECFRHIWF